MTDQEFKKLCNLADKYKINQLEFPKNKQKLKKIEFINLKNKNISEFPKELLYLPLLKKIDLSNNKLTKIPKEINDFKNLTNLNLSYNQITELPKEIYQLENLNFLRLENNNIKELSREIINLKNLKSFIIDIETKLNIKYKKREKKNITKIKKEYFDFFLNLSNFQIAYPITQYRPDTKQNNKNKKSFITNKEDIKIFLKNFIILNEDITYISDKNLNFIKEENINLDFYF